MIKEAYKRLIPERQRLAIRFFSNSIKSYLYRGDKFYCNCCNKQFSRFLTKGNISRQNAECPNCGSLERTRLLLFYLRNETYVFSRNIKLLHIAPERCLQKIFKNQKNIDYIDGDINPAYANHVIDITKINYPDNYFDVIICSHVLGHIPAEDTALQELYRVLKKDGYALIMTLIGNNSDTYESEHIITEKDRLMHYGELDLCRLHGQDFSARLEKQNFKVEKIDYRAHFSEEEQQRYSLGNGERELIFKCFKP